jgi:hypothetical protein
MKEHSDPVMRRTQQLFRALFVDNDGARAAAASALYRHLRDHELHPDNLVLDRYGEQHVRYQRVIEYMQRDLVEAHRKLDFLRPQIDRKLWARAERAAGVTNRWAELAELADRRLGGLRRGWKGRVRTMLGVGEKPFRAWERGLAPIPDAVFEVLRAAAVPPPKARKPQQALTGPATVLRT